MNCHITFVYEGQVDEARIRELSLSVILAARHYKVLLHTNLVKRIERLNLPCEIVPTEVPDSERFWVERKLRTYMLASDADAPFIHIDHDVFLIDPLPAALVKSRLFAQSDESAGLYRRLPSMPNRWAARFAGPLNPFRAYNTGIFGGNPAAVRAYADHALEAARSAPLDTPATYIEQATLGRWEAAVLFRNGHPSPKGYVHLMQAKSRPEIQRKITERLRVELPRSTEPAPSTPAPETCFVELGRFGDIINLLPVCRDIARKTGRPVAVTVAEPFAAVLHGVSYVRPFSLPISHLEVLPALKEARARFSNAIVTQVYANGWDPGKQCQSYNMESWRLAGYLDRWADPDIRLEFDRRDYRREREVIQKVWPTDGKPVVLFNVEAGHSSPFQEWREFQNAMIRRWQDQISFVEIGALRCERIYDMVGLMELADGLVTIDTSTLHLAAATSVPTVALLSAIGPWNQTTPRCNCRLGFPSNQWRSRMADVDEAIISFLGRPRVIHAFDKRPESNPRIDRAQASWGVTGWIPAPYSENRYRRSAASIGDARNLPFLRDVLANALESAEDRDFIVYTNDDITLTPETDAEVRKLLGRAVMITGRRVEIGKENHIHYGRDLIAFRAGWLRVNIDSIPDFILGASQWDLWAACKARLLCGIGGVDEARRMIGIVCPKSREFEVFDSPSCEMKRGTVLHEPHTGTWTLDEESPSENHNRLAFEKWKLQI
jgi:hypothetical protein